MQSIFKPAILSKLPCKRDLYLIILGFNKLEIQQDSAWRKCFTFPCFDWGLKYFSSTTFLSYDWRHTRPGVHSKIGLMAKLGNSQHTGGMFKTTNNVAGCHSFLRVFKEVRFKGWPARVSTSAAVSKICPALLRGWITWKIIKEISAVYGLVCCWPTCTEESLELCEWVLFSAPVALPDPLPDYEARNCCDWLELS